MYPAISYELAKARITDLRRQAQRDTLARAVTHLSWSAPRSDRNQILVSLRSWPGSRRRAYQARGHRAASSRAAAAASSGSSAGNGRQPQRPRRLQPPGPRNYPRMTYGRHASAQQGPLLARGELTFTGVAKNVPLALKVNGFGPDVGGTGAGLTATGEFNWQDFGVICNAVIGAGRVAVATRSPSASRSRRAPGISRVHQPDPEPVPIDAQEPR